MESGLFRQSYARFIFALIIQESVLYLFCMPEKKTLIRIYGLNEPLRLIFDYLSYITEY